MKVRSLIIALVIVLTPFIIGIPLFLARSSGRIPARAHLSTDTRKTDNGMTYKGIKIDWTFYPDWEHKPLFFHAEEYLVFMFYYTNNNDYNVSVMPSYAFVSPPSRRYSANEEVSMYIEDGVEKKLKVEDQTPITFEISPNATKHYIVTFEKPHSLGNFYIDVDVFRDVSLRIHYRKRDDKWENYKNEWLDKYVGRG
ncbi:MAG: hypothetical protein U9R44_07985 [Candidatus Omnitrophota bacterium]|nr:hypothetical protein [Candidatus Omnitrophota bacterium]